MVAGVPNDGNGGAGHSLRSDMNWDSMDTNVLEHWQKVGVFRNNHISVGAGSNTSLAQHQVMLLQEITTRTALQIR